MIAPRADPIGIGDDVGDFDLPVTGLENISTCARLFEELARRGWSDADLARLAGRNLLRVVEAADTAARRARDSRGAR